jgi:hypothetical protein
MKKSVTFKIPKYRLNKFQKLWLNEVLGTWRSGERYNSRERKVSDNKDDFTIGHPFRTADHGGLVYLFSGLGFKGFPIISQTPSPNALTRTTDNVQQTERSEADAKKELQAPEK